MANPTWQEWIKVVAAIHKGSAANNDNEELIRYYYDLEVQRIKRDGKPIPSTSFPNGIASNSWYHYKTHKDKKYSLVCADLDGTLIEPKSGNRFPQNIDDWKLIIPNVKQIQSHYHQAAISTLIIFTNQGGIHYGIMKAWEFEKKMEAVKDALYDYFEQISYYYAPSYDECRKPDTGMFEKARQDYSLIIPEKSIYFGDMDSDREFALNTKMEYLSFK